MTAHSELIESLLAYKLTDFILTNAEQNVIVRLLRSDPAIDQTMSDLESKQLLSTLVGRMSSGNRDLLAQTLAGKVSRVWGPRVAYALRDYPRPKKLFDLCFELQQALRGLGVARPAPTLSSPAVAALNPKAPFTGSGATGVSPTALSIEALDKLLLAFNHQSTVDEYSNPIPGSLSDYLAGLSVADRRAQVTALVSRPIVTAYPTSYVGGVPLRGTVLRAAGSKYNLAPGLIAAFVLAEQRDQSQMEDAKDYLGAASVLKGNTSIGLGQVVVSTARRHHLFSVLLPLALTQGLTHTEVAKLLASDEFNIVAVAKYLRLTADAAVRLNAGQLPKTKAKFPGIDFGRFGLDSRLWPPDNIRALGSEYTSRPWDDVLSPGWGDFVYEAYRDVVAAGVL